MSPGLQTTHSQAAYAAIADRKVTEQGEACRLRNFSDSLGVVWRNRYMAITHSTDLQDQSHNWQMYRYMLSQMRWKNLLGDKRRT